MSASSKYRAGGLKLTVKNDRDGIGVAVSEWEAIKSKIKALDHSINFWHIVGSALVGAGLGTLLKGLGSGSASEREWWIAGLAVLLGVTVFAIGHGGRVRAKEQASTIITVMEVIDDRYEKGSDATQ